MIDYIYATPLEWVHSFRNHNERTDVLQISSSESIEYVFYSLLFAVFFPSLKKKFSHIHSQQLIILVFLQPGLSAK